MSLTVTDKDGDSGQDAKTIQVLNVAPTLLVSITPTDINEGEAVGLQLLASDPGADTISAWSVDWSDLSSATLEGNDLSISHNYDDGPNSYTVQVSATDEDGTYQADPVEVTVRNVSPSPTIIDLPWAPCEGTLMELGSSVIEPSAADRAAGLHYLWSVQKDDQPYGLPAGTTIDQADFAFTPDDNGQYAVTLTVSDKDGGAGYDTKLIDVANVAPEVSITRDEGALVEGTAVSFTSQVTDAGAADRASLTYLWSVQRLGSDEAYHAYTLPEDVVTNDTTFSFTPDDNASYEVTLTVTDKDHDSGSDEMNLYVANVPPEVAITRDEGALLEGTAVSFSSQVADAGAADVAAGLSYLWSVQKDEQAYELPQGVATDGVTFSFIPDDNATYTVRLTVTDKDHDSGSDSTSFDIANAPPEVAISRNEGDLLEGTAVTLTGSALDSPADEAAQFDYLWTVMRNDLLYGETFAEHGLTSTFTFTPDDNGLYEVMVTATDKDGESGTARQTLTVDNVAPTLTLSGTSEVDEGAIYFLELSASDPGTDTIDHWTIDWGDGSDPDADGQVGETVYDNPTFAMHTYADGENDYTILVHGFDEDSSVSGYSAAPLDVTVHDVLPSLYAWGDAWAQEGSPYSIDLSAYDPGVNDTIQSWTIDWGDGSNAQSLAGAASSATHTYAEGPSNYSIQVSASSAGVLVSADAFLVAVENAPPQADFALTTSGSIAEGSAASFGFSNVVDSSQDMAAGFTYSFDFDGDGVFDVSHSTNPSADHTFADNGIYTVWGRVTDRDGGFNDYSAEVTIDNVAPTLTLQRPDDPLHPGQPLLAIKEGDSYAITLHASDSGTDTIGKWRIDWGDGQIQTIAGTPTEPVPHNYLLPDDYTISATAKDEDGTYDSNTLSLSVANVAPLISIAKISDSTLSGSEFTLRLDSSDAGAEPLVNWNIDWGDESTSTVNGQSWFAQHVYAHVDVITTYTVTATAYDGYASSDPATLTVNVAPPPEIPQAPANFAAEQAEPYNLHLTWTRPPGPVDGYKLEYSSDNVHFYALQETPYSQTLSAETTSFDVSWPPGQTYYFRLRAFNAYGFSSPATLSAITPSASYLPDPPSNLSYSLVPNDPYVPFFALNWTETTEHVSGYQVQFRNPLDPIHNSPYGEWFNAGPDVPADMHAFNDGGHSNWSPNEPSTHKPVSATIADLNLTIDSNNDGQINAADDAIEDDPSLPGKFISTNNQDEDLDGIRGFLDGYDQDMSRAFNDDDRQGLDVVQRLVPIRLTLPEWVDPSQATVSFVYSGSGLGASAPAGLRIWKSNAAVRESQDYIAPSDAELWTSLTDAKSERTLTLYVEALDGSSSLGDRSIAVQVDPGGGSGTGHDSVRLTALNADLNAMDDAVDVNSDDDDGNGITDAEELNPSTADPDLVEVDLTWPNFGSGCNLTLSIDSGSAGRVRIWSSPTKENGGELLLGVPVSDGPPIQSREWQATTLSTDIPNKVWIEALQTAERSFDLQMNLVVNIPGGEEASATKTIPVWNPYLIVSFISPDPNEQDERTLKLVFPVGKPSRAGYVSPSDQIKLKDIIEAALDNMANEKRKFIRIENLEDRNSERRLYERRINRVFNAGNRDTNGDPATPPYSNPAAAVREFGLKLDTLFSSVGNGNKLTILSDSRTSRYAMYVMNGTLYVNTEYNDAWNAALALHEITHLYMNTKDSLGGINEVYWNDYSLISIPSGYYYLDSDSYERYHVGNPNEIFRNLSPFGTGSSNGYLNHADTWRAYFYVLFGVGLR